MTIRFARLSAGENSQPESFLDYVNFSNSCQPPTSICVVVLVLEHSTVTNLTGSLILVFLRMKTATRPHVMSSATYLESGQGAQAAPRAGAFFSLSYYRPLDQKW